MYRGGSGDLQANRGGKRVGDVREILVQRLQRCQQGDQRLRDGRLDDQPRAIAPHHGVLARKLKLPGDPNGLVTAIPEKLYAAFCNHDGHSLLAQA